MRELALLSAGLLLIGGVFASNGEPGSRRAGEPGGIILAGEPLVVDGDFTIRFTARQIAETAPSTRAGLVQWAATGWGRKLVAHFSRPEYEIVVREDATDDATGSAPQPGIATLVASADHATLKRYELILNPTPLSVPEGIDVLPDQPVTASDFMAVTWAAEMLHIYFYSQGISLPHHKRADFQKAWREMAAELGFPGLRHGDEDEGGRDVVRRWRRE